jgi:hypothetical protein
MQTKVQGEFNAETQRARRNAEGKGRFFSALLCGLCVSALIGRRL